jgi:hypothetical protein
MFSFLTSDMPIWLVLIIGVVLLMLGGGDGSGIISKLIELIFPKPKPKSKPRWLRERRPLLAAIIDGDSMARVGSDGVPVSVSAATYLDVDADDVQAMTKEADQAYQEYLAGFGEGGILDGLLDKLKGMLPILLLVGAVIFLPMMMKGCNKDNNKAEVPPAQLVPVDDAE